MHSIQAFFFHVFSYAVALYFAGLLTLTLIQFLAMPFFFYLLPSSCRINSWWRKKEKKKKKVVNLKFFHFSINRENPKKPFGTESQCIQLPHHWTFLCWTMGKITFIRRCYLCFITCRGSVCMWNGSNLVTNPSREREIEIERSGEGVRKIINTFS